MKKKRLLLILLILICCTVAPSVVHAQLAEPIVFTTRFPFFVGNARMPPGSYRVRQEDADVPVLLIAAEPSGKFAAFIDIIPAQADATSPHNEVVFHRYGDREYLSKIWVEDQASGMQVEMTKTEKRDAAKATAAEHSVPLKQVRKH
jgi:hypothetical protein